MPRSNAPYLAGLGTWVVLFFGIAALTGQIVPALVLGFVLGVAVTFVVHGLFPSSPELDYYRADARRRVKKLYAAVERIRRSARNLPGNGKPEQKAVLDEGCQAVLDLVHLTQEKDSGSVAKTAARLYNYVLDVELVLTQYLEVQANTNYYDNAPELIQRGEQGFGTFREFAINSIRQVNAGEIMAYKASLEKLEPLPRIG
jgi:hypothetical protein